MKVLITGSSGRIGAAVAEALPAEAERIGIDVVPGAHTTHQEDLSHSRKLPHLVSEADVIFHVAALHAPHVRRRPQEEFRRINVDATAALLEAALAAKAHRFVFTSTTSVYGCTTRPKDRAVWVTEELEPNPEDIYDETKLEAEELCRKASGPSLSVAVLRVSRCFPEAPHLMAFYRLYRGVDLRDAAQAHVLAAGAELGPCSIFNVSAHTLFTEADCQALWTDPWKVIDEKVEGLRSAFQERGWPRPARIDRVYAIGKAHRELGYKPEHDVWSALAEGQAG